MPLHTLSIAGLQRVPERVQTDDGTLPIATFILISPLKRARKRRPEESFWCETMRRCARPSLPAIPNMGATRSYNQDLALWRICDRWREYECSSWLSRMQVVKDMETEKLKRNRLQAIQLKLACLGYGAELAAMPSVDILAKHSLVNQTRPLTDRIWTNIQGELAKYMEKVKVDRLAREHHELLQRRRKVVIDYLRICKALSPSTLFPPLLDFFELPSIRKIIHLPSNETVTPGHFHRITELILLHIDAWESSVTQQVIDFTIGKDSPMSPEEKSSEVELARNNKPAYITPLFFPDILGHRCLSLGFDEIRCTGTSVRVPWNTARLEINDRAREVINALMAFIGADPETTTAEGLDDEMEDYQLKCYSCPNKKYVHNGAAPVSTFELYGWRDFVKNILIEHYDDTTPLEYYVKLIHADTFWADDWFILEKVLDGGVFLSQYCTDLPCESYYRGYDSMVEHLRNDHGLTTVTDDVDIYARGHELLPEQRSARTTEGIGIVPE
ncbi:hypothetical protein ARMGADRAFT_1077697 [Armillaria gallica]|uniref:Uncharacterized protein n=1 Tax=Armillaria gallica TaxID=47427 RepID=A0A2H3DQ57_ARMGA|nr:hypothetical protein ARMGADRAFT_1077697 [Armillaria gallica]